MSGETVLSSQEAFIRDIFLRVIAGGPKEKPGVIRRVQIHGERLTVEAESQSALDVWAREHEGYGRKYPVDPSAWDRSDFRKFSILVTKYRTEFFVVLRESEGGAIAHVLPRKGEQF